MAMMMAAETPREALDEKIEETNEGYIAILRECTEAIVERIRACELPAQKMTHAVAMMLIDPDFVKIDGKPGHQSSNEHVATLAALAAVLLVDRANT